MRYESELVLTSAHDRLWDAVIRTVSHLLFRRIDRGDSKET
jgi:hypothetical protein